MAKAITNTLPALYLYRIGVLNWLPQIFDEVCISQKVVEELKEGRGKGYDVPNPENYDWLRIVDTEVIPDQWNSLSLGSGELTTMAFALAHPDYIVLFDDLLARRTAQAAGLTVWGTLQILLEAKKRGLVPAVSPAVDNFAISGMWFPAEVRRRLLTLAGER